MRRRCSPPSFVPQRSATTASPVHQLHEAGRYVNASAVNRGHRPGLPKRRQNHDERKRHAGINEHTSHSLTSQGTKREYRRAYTADRQVGRRQGGQRWPRLYHADAGDRPGSLGDVTR